MGLLENSVGSEACSDVFLKMPSDVKLNLSGGRLVEIQDHDSEPGHSVLVSVLVAEVPESGLSNNTVRGRVVLNHRYPNNPVEDRVELYKGATMTVSPREVLVDGVSVYSRNGQ